MADATIRERLIDAVEVRLSGYAWTTLEEPTVHVGKAVFNTEEDEAYPDRPVDPLPLFAVLAGPEETEQKRYGVDTNTMPVSITCIVSLEDGADVDAICEPVFGEMKKALFAGGHLEIGTEEAGTEPEAFPFFPTGGGIEDYPEELGPAIVKIQISAVVIYETATGDPYN
jgi:hypothetical protein